MRRIVAYVLTSVDGAVDRPGSYFPPDPGSSVPGFDDELRAREEALTSRQDLVLLGRRTHDEWSVFWPTSDDQPFASFINGVDKVVLTTRPIESRWGEVRSARGDLATVASELRDLPGSGDIGVHGSISVVQQLLAADAVDELHLAVGPILQGEGQRLLPAPVAGREVPDSVHLDLVESAATSGGALWLVYRPG